MDEIQTMFRLDGKVAIITGGAGLLGVQHAHVLADAGANVAIVDIASKRSFEIAKEITEKYKRKAIGVTVDVSSKPSVEQMVRQVIDAFGRIDILINNAAINDELTSDTSENHLVPFEEYPLELWEKSLAVNLAGMFLCAQAVGKQMVKQGRGVIVNISSIYGTVGPDQRIYEPGKKKASQQIFKPVSYSVSKGAIASLTRYLATYWAGKNIRVNTLTPGGVFDNQDEAFVENYSMKTPLGRMAHKTELGGAILFLASDASSYMTGANLVVDGGWTAW